MHLWTWGQNDCPHDLQLASITVIFMFAFVLFVVYVLPFVLVLVFASVFSLSILESYYALDAHVLICRDRCHRGGAKPFVFCALLCRAICHV